jgi:hypothetical protein
MMGKQRIERPLPIYVDNGAHVAEVKGLEKRGLVIVHRFKYEGTARRIVRGAVPSSAAQWSDFKGYTFDALKRDAYLSTMSFDQWRAASARSRFREIVAIVGKSNRIDAMHLDSAQLVGCIAFVTNDRDDIASKTDALFDLLGLRVFLVPANIGSFVNFIEDALSTPRGITP